MSSRILSERGHCASSQWHMASRWLGRLAAILMACSIGGILGAVPARADTHIFTTNTTISDTNFTYEGDDIVVQGCTLTINGGHEFNSLTVERNASNQAGVVTHTTGFTNGTINGCFLTIATDASIQGASGSLVASRMDVSAKGYGSASGPGAGGSSSGYTGGGGAGYGGKGGNGASTAGGLAYGSITQPLDLGSGGGTGYGGNAGGSGGGILRVTVAGALQLDGQLTANGASGSGSAGGGSGGSVYVTAGSLAGVGAVSANGGAAGPGFGGHIGGGGGGGIIAIYYDDMGGFPPSHITVTGGTGYQAGWVGTIHLQAILGACCFDDGSCSVATEGDCSVAGGANWILGATCEQDPCPPPMGACCFGDGSCQVLVETDCGAFGGTAWLLNETCGANPCPESPVKNAAASQRADATRLVDICYTLAGEEESYDITLLASSNGGATWSIVPTSVSGNVGDNVSTGSGRHVVWNINVDLPGGTGSNFRVRVIADGTYYGDSNVFAVGAAGPGGLTGTVQNQATGQPIAGATVTVTGQPPFQTGPNGQFSFSGVQAGYVMIEVSAPGYCGITQPANITGFSQTVVAILLTPHSGFGICDVRAWFCGPGNRVFYLDQVDLTETFNASIDWAGHSPGYVRWTILSSEQEYQTLCTSGSASREFNMGTDFGPGGTLQAVAVTGDNPPIESTPYDVAFKVIPPPPGADPNELHPVWPFMVTLKYSTIRLGGDPSQVQEGVEQGWIPNDMPLFGKEALKLGLAFDFGMEVDDKGKATGTTFEPLLKDLKKGERRVGTQMAGYKFAPQVSGQVGWEFREDPDRWVSTGEVEFGADFKVDVPPKPMPVMFGPIPGYWRAAVEIGILGHLDITGWDGTAAPTIEGSIHLDPTPYVEGALGVGVADVVALEGSLGGGARWTLHFPALPPNPILEKLQIYLAGKAKLVIFIFKWEWPFLNWTWDVYGGRWVVEQGDPVFGLMSRDYLGRRAGYAVFVANDCRRGSRDVVTQETPIQLNVFDQSTPDLAAVGNNLLAVWVYDDPVRTPTNRTEIVFSKYDAGTQTWTQPVAVADDGTADFHPQVAALPNGDALLVWENASEAVIEPGEPNDPCIQPCRDQCVGDPDPAACEAQCRLQCKYAELKGKTEIAAARYDGQTGTWAAQTILTSNAYLDRSPRIAVAADGTALLTWVSNAGNEEIGSNTSPNTIQYSRFDGAQWSAPTTLAGNVTSVVKNALAYNGSAAVLLFVGDTDNNTATPDDRELFAASYTGGTWGPVTQITDDPDDPNDPNNPPIEDANPQVAYDSNGDLLLVWYRGGDIVMATNLALSDLRTIVDRGGGASSGAADFRLATGSGGQISLVWQDASEDRVDIWSAIYDPTLEVWTKPQRLTADAQIEHALAPTYDATGDLIAVYDKVTTVYETRTVYINGEPIVIDHVPVPDQTDLYLLRHIIGGDLAATADGIEVDPPNPVVGQIATISATIRNLGDVAAANVAVAFYDGDPGGSGIPIGTATYAGPLVGGADAQVSVPWLVPSSAAAHDIYVVVDPTLVQEDRDRTNNTAILAGVTKPDLIVESILVQAAGADRILTVRVLNASGSATSNFGVTLRRDAVNGDLLQSFTITDTLVPGAFYDVSWTWENAIPIVGGSVTVFAIVDEVNLIDEFDEGNNVRSTTLTNPPPSSPGDWNGDGHVDATDWLAFPTCMSGPWDLESWTMPTQDCLDVFDFNADADVDLLDFAEFQAQFTGGG